MLYLIHWLILLTWLGLMIIRHQMTWHALVVTYAVMATVIDNIEVLSNLYFELIRFPPNLMDEPLADNQLGIIFADTLILPITGILYIRYVDRNNKWPLIVMMTLLYFILEYVYHQTGYLYYLNWSIWISVAFYFTGFWLFANIAHRLKHYAPPIPLWIRLSTFAYTVHMWTGATLALPVLGLYQFTPGLFDNPYADDRFLDLYSGLVIGILSGMLLPKVSERYKFAVLSGITLLGFSFAYVSYLQGWLVYHHWNHMLMFVRYLLPNALIGLYDRWERAYDVQKIAA